MRWVVVLFMFQLILAGAALAPGGAARADEHDCPNHPESTYTLEGDPDTDRSHIGKLASEAKERGAVCVLAFYDSKGTSNAKMLAFRRANWVMEQLTDKGVPANIISRVLRAVDSHGEHTVQIILGP